MKNCSPPIVKYVRSFKNYSKGILCNELSNVSWSSVLLAPNVDVALDNFSNIFLSIVNKVAPFRRMRFRKDSEPWMTAEIIGEIKKRDLLLQR